MYVCIKKAGPWCKLLGVVTLMAPAQLPYKEMVLICSLRVYPCPCHCANIVLLWFWLSAHLIGEK